MNQTQKDLFEVTQKNIYIQEDLQIPDPQNYIRKYQINLRDSLLSYCGTGSFITDWQLPDLEIHDFDKPQSH